MPEWCTNSLRILKDSLRKAVAGSRSAQAERGVTLSGRQACPASPVTRDRRDRNDEISAVASIHELGAETEFVLKYCGPVLKI